MQEAIEEFLEGIRKVKELLPSERTWYSLLSFDGKRGYET